MAFGGVKFFKGFGAGKLPPDLLNRSVRKSIELCWLLQKQNSRSKEDIERIILGIFSDEMKNFEDIVKDL
jgi:hypothetical protein